MKTLMKFLAVVLVAGLWPGAAAAQTTMDPELRDQGRQAADQGLRFLRSSQLDNGAWSYSVGITALALRAFLESHNGYTENDGPFITKPVQFLLANVRDNGAIAESGQNLNYNTATAIVALQATGNAEYAPVIAGAQAFLTGLQIDEGEDYTPDHQFYGGIGYGGDERPDLANIYLTLEALRYSAHDPDDPVWEKAMAFVSRTQNNSETNDQAWAGNDGGFTYLPGESPHAGTRSYGAMTSAGLISLIFVGADREDPRIEAAWDWIGDNYTLDEHPGIAGRHALFYYYTVFAKAMYAMNEDTITDSDGRDHNWRDELVTKLMDLQGEDGSWVNPYSDRWWEDNKDLITARAVIALNLATR